MLINVIALEGKFEKRDRGNFYRMWSEPQVFNTSYVTQMVESDPTDQQLANFPNLVKVTWIRMAWNCGSDIVTTEPLAELMERIEHARKI